MTTVTFNNYRSFLITKAHKEQNADLDTLAKTATTKTLKSMFLIGAYMEGYNFTTEGYKKANENSPLTPSEIAMIVRIHNAGSVSRVELEINPFDKEYARRLLGKNIIRIDAEGIITLTAEGAEKYKAIAKKFAL